MSNLDDELREIKASGKLYSPNGGLDKYLELDDKTIAQIKQAFADEGYIQPETLKKGIGIMDAQGYKSGQEWYDRFEKELLKEFTKKPPKNTMVLPGWTKEDAKNLWVAMGIDAAARKAAGLKDKA